MLEASRRDGNVAGAGIPDFSAAAPFHSCRGTAIFAGSIRRQPFASRPDPPKGTIMDSILALLTDPAAWAALATLIVMEVVLGIDNLVFISILTNKLPETHRARARRIGIGLALVLRLALLGAIAWIVQLTDPLFELFDHGFSWKDLILIAGGLFLVWKATKEIHHNVDPDPHGDMFGQAAMKIGFAAAITQILLLDLVFSIDSIITAVGMTPHVPIMVVAVIVAVSVMLLAAGPLSRFIAANPTIVMLALGFLLLIGTTLIAEGFGAHVPRGYIYAAMAFSGLVEGLNMLSRRARARKLAIRERG
jgi:predicted tellurium resistance membrane protein TerC